MRGGGGGVREDEEQLLSSVRASEISDPFVTLRGRDKMSVDQIRLNFIDPRLGNCTFIFYLKLQGEQGKVPVIVF